LSYTLAMVQTAVMDTADLESGSYVQKPNGAGAFSFSEWQQGQDASLTSNPTYWAGEPEIDEVEFRVIPEESSILAGLRAGSFQVGLLTDPALVRQSDESEGLRVQRVPSLNYHVLQLNGRKTPLDDVKVRQAIACAVDRQEVIDTASDGEGVITGPITSPGFEFDPTKGLPCEPGDLDAARGLMAEAGHADGLTLRTVVMTGAYATAVDEATNLQSQLAKIGVTLDIEQQPTNVYVQSWLKADYDAALALNSGDFSPYKMYASYYGEGASYAAPAGLDSPRLQDLLAQANASSDGDEQTELYARIQEELVRESPWVWLFRGNNYAVVQEGVQGVTIGPDNSLRSIRTATVD
jgi:peptide/nickel transport system substrate-binding protein